MDIGFLVKVAITAIDIDVYALCTGYCYYFYQSLPLLSDARSLTPRRLRHAGPDNRQPRFVPEPPL